VPGTCGICGERCVERENSDGSYKGACVDCINSFEHPGRHVDTCDKSDCVVCESYRDENGGG
jgi:hypothetical protein